MPSSAPVQLEHFDVSGKFSCVYFCFSSIQAFSQECQSRYRKTSAIPQVGVQSKHVQSLTHARILSEYPKNNIVTTNFVKQKSVCWFGRPFKTCHLMESFKSLHVRCIGKPSYCHLEPRSGQTTCNRQKGSGAICSISQYIAMALPQSP